MCAAGAYPAASSSEQGSFLQLVAGAGRAAPPLQSLVANISSDAVLIPATFATFREVNAASKGLSS